MNNLTEIVREEVAKYAGSGRGANVILFPNLDDENQVYAVTAFDYPTRRDILLVLVFARIVDGVIVIQEDKTDKPLYQALLQRGIPREKIVLAYAGEPIPNAERFAV